MSRDLLQRPTRRQILTRASLLALATQAKPTPALAAPAMATSRVPAGLTPLRTGTVTGIIDGDTIHLDDGTEVRLVGIQAPKLALGRRNFQDWPLAQPAQAALATLALGRTVTLYKGGVAVDRWNRILAHLIRDDGVWIQGTMLEQGWARQYSLADNLAAIDPMRQAERRARSKRLGIWDHPFYAIRSADRVADEIGTYQIVSGTPQSVTQHNGTVYVNFDRDYRQDFTLTASRGNRNRIAAQGIELEKLVGRAIEVRGWIERRNGPMIQLTHAGQIDLSV